MNLQRHQGTCQEDLKQFCSISDLQSVHILVYSGSEKKKVVKHKKLLEHKKKNNGSSTEHSKKCTHEMPQIAKPTMLCVCLTQSIVFVLRPATADHAAGIKVIQPSVHTLLATFAPNFLCDFGPFRYTRANTLQNDAVFFRSKDSRAGHFYRWWWWGLKGGCKDTKKRNKQWRVFANSDAVVYCKKNMEYYERQKENSQLRKLVLCGKKRE